MHNLHTLYVVNHGTRESIEILEVDATQEPRVHWKGCLLMPGSGPETAVANSVAPLPDGGIVVTVSNLAKDNPFMQKLAHHEVTRDTGYLLEWHAGGGWKEVPGSGGAYPNGVEVSSDGSWLYVTYSGTQYIVRLSRGTATVQRSVIDVHMIADNVRWDSEGRLWIAGQLDDCAVPVCTAPYLILELDPRTMRFKQVPHPITTPEFGAATVALPLDNDVWVGTYQGNRIARFPLASMR
jgi:sugar lactone lactonase YvrE